MHIEKHFLELHIHRHEHMNTYTQTQHLLHINGLISGSISEKVFLRTSDSCPKKWCYVTVQKVIHIVFYTIYIMLLQEHPVLIFLSGCQKHNHLYHCPKISTITITHNNYVVFKCMHAIKISDIPLG